MAILHTIARSPFQNQSLAGCVHVLRPGAGVLLLEDGVYAARAANEAPKLLDGVDGQVTIYALEADLRARGIADSELLECVSVVDYAGFVALACQYDTVQAWF